MIDDMVPAVRETLAVNSSYDETNIKPGIRRAITFLLRTWSFPQAQVMQNFPLVAGDKVIALPASGVGKIKAVRLVHGTGADTVYRMLRKTEAGELPREHGPFRYWMEGNSLVLDTEIPAAGYSVDIWYMSTDPLLAEPWITADFEDVVFTLSVMRLAGDLRKPEVQQQFQQAWSELVPTLAQYLVEVEHSDQDIRFVPDSGPSRERYPA